MSIKVDRRAFLGAAALAIADRYLSQVAFANNEQHRLANNTTSPPTYRISEVISGNRIESEYKSYFRVALNTDAFFYIVQRKDSKGQKIFELSYDLADKRQGRIFPAPEDYSKPVALVDGKGADLNGIFEIYDRGDYYSVSYNFSPLIYIPSHTEISSVYLLTVDKSLKDLPKDLTDTLNENKRRLMLAKNIEDSYYWLYPYWREEDRNHHIDPKKPWIEKVNGVWIDNRRHENVPGYYLSDRSMIVMPQRYIKYATEDEVIDRVNDHEWNKATVFHEIGHALDYLRSPLYSDARNYDEAYNRDLAKIPNEEQERVGYFLMNKVEPFAELVGALLGGFSRDRAARILDYFPDAAEHIRVHVLPKYGYEISEDDVRGKIYPGYRKHDVKARTQFKLALLKEDPLTLCA